MFAQETERVGFITNFKLFPAQNTSGFVVVER